MTGEIDLDAAYAHCQALAGAHYENFPVASALVPKAIRPHVAAVYAFARTADDFADEPGYSARERLRLLDEWRERLHAALGAARAADVPPGGGAHPTPAASPESYDLIFTAVAHTIRQCDLPVAQFEALLSAFRQDVTVTRYASWADVHDYCRRSANPVGRLVLRLFGHRDDELDGWSDCICTALQLTNFWQDFAVDWSRGRLYVPEEVWRDEAADPAGLRAGMADTPRAWQGALAVCARHTRALFDRGRPLLAHTRGRLRWELAATWHGGRRILERLEQGRFDPAAHRPTLGMSDGLVIAWRMLVQP